MFPNNYAYFTVDNFIIQPKKISVSGSSNAGNASDYPNLGGGVGASGGNTSGITKSYSNGIFTVGNVSTSASYSNSTDGGKLGTNGSCNAKLVDVEVYLAMGSIKQI